MWRRFMGVTGWVDETQGFMTLFVAQGQKLQREPQGLMDCPVFVPPASKHGRCAWART
jgi:hypothetical protein